MASLSAIALDDRDLRRPAMVRPAAFALSPPSARKPWATTLAVAVAMPSMWSGTLTILIAAVRLGSMRDALHARCVSRERPSTMGRAFGPSLTGRMRGAALC